MHQQTKKRKSKKLPEKKEINLIKSELQKKENDKRKPKKSMSKRKDHDN